MEWNDRFRDSVRTFWLSDVRAAQHGHTGHGIRDLATRLAGSQDLFEARDRGPLASVNFVTAHDGFTLADLTAYNRKHNGANGEGNRDGTDDNRSYNHGREGWADAGESILRDRRRSMRNLMATLLLANGVPMLNAGDELGRTQWGNNNPYCLDIEEMWVDWELEPWRADLLETARFLTGLRRRHPVLRQRTFHTGQPVSADGSLDVAWYGTDGVELDTGGWESAATHTLQMLLGRFPRNYREIEWEIKQNILRASFFLHNAREELQKLDHESYLDNMEKAAVKVALEYVDSVIEDFRLKDLKQK